LHLQHPNLSHNDLLRKILLDLQEFMSRFSPITAERLTRSQESLAIQQQTLGQFTFNLGSTESDMSAVDLSCDTVSMLREALDSEITTTLGYMPDSSEAASLKRRLWDADLETEAGYRRFLKSTFGVDQPLGLPEFRLENGVLQSK